RAQIAGLGARGCACLGGAERRPCPPTYTPTPGDFAPDSGARRCGASGAGPGASGRPDPAPGRGPQLGRRWGPQAARDTLPRQRRKTRREREVAASGTGGPELFVRISGLATPPCSVFVDRVAELGPAVRPGSPPPAAARRELKTRPRKLQIWDTAGQERFRAITQSYYRSAHGAILAYDVTQRRSFLSLPRWIADVRKYAGSGTVQLLIGNKSDLVELREVPLAEAQGLAEHYDILCAIETSAKDSSNVEEAFVRVATELVVRHGGPRLSEKGADHIQLDSKDIAESWGCSC
uniref:RAB43, member RAS oncogene family n=1 Tax=Moschus moschiferus TaxID=68415 RepID=A0A8C6G0J6_MOSMO